MPAEFLANTEQQLQNMDLNESRDINPGLNSDITLDEVAKAVYKAKLRKASGFDGIPAEVLKNPRCIGILHMIIGKCFDIGQVPALWNKSVINPIFKSGDNRDPLNITTVTLASFV